MENSKIRLIFPCFFIFVFIFALTSQKCSEKWVKYFFHRFPWKFLYNLILMWRIQISNSFSQIVSFTSPFLPQLVKNVLIFMSNYLFSDFHENCHKTKFWYGEFKNQIHSFKIFHLYLHFWHQFFSHPHQANRQS